MSGIAPMPKLPKLIVVVALKHGEEGELPEVFDPAEQQSEERAMRTARGLAEEHAGVIALPWPGSAPLRDARSGARGNVA